MDPVMLDPVTVWFLAVFFGGPFLVLFAGYLLSVVRNIFLDGREFKVNIFQVPTESAKRVQIRFTVAPPVTSYGFRSYGIIDDVIATDIKSGFEEANDRAQDYIDKYRRKHTKVEMPAVKYSFNMHTGEVSKYKTRGSDDEQN